MHPACFSSDSFLELLLQAFPLSLRRAIVFSFEPSEVHPKDQAVVERLLAAGVRSVSARWLLPNAATIVAGLVQSLERVKHSANHCSLARYEALHRRPILKQAMQHCFHEAQRNPGYSPVHWFILGRRSFGQAAQH